MPSPSFCVLCRGNGYVACSRCFLPVCRRCHKHIDDVKICLKCFKADSTFQRSRGETSKGKLERTSAIVIGAVLGFVLIARFVPYHAGQQSTSQVRFSSQRADERSKQIEDEDNARTQETEIDSEPLEIVQSNWYRGTVNPVALWEVTFRNRSKKPVGNIKFRTEYFSETGKTISKGGLNRTSSPLVKVIPPLSSRTITINDGFVQNEARDASFDLVGWEFVQDGK